MGVKGLWEILSEAKEEITSLDVERETWAVDLAGWVCEAESVKPMQNVVLHPYLRTLLFRIKTLSKHKIKLVFVLDGKIPELKINTVLKRLGTENTKNKNPTTRKRLNYKFKQCCLLLDHLQIPWLQADGEAESVCAQLNEQGLVDAVVTNDSDVLLYGANTVYRNFNCTQKKTTYTRYKTSVIQETTKLGRNHFIGLGLLLGCDFCDKGVPGVGKVQAVKLMESWNESEVLENLNKWKTKGCTQSSNSIEKKIYSKSQKVPNFPNPTIIDEFLKTHGKLIRQFKLKTSNRSAIKFNELVKLLDVLLGWDKKYSMDTMLPYFTNLLFTGQIDSLGENIEFEKVVAERTRDKLPVYECDWLISDDCDHSCVTTFECRSHVEQHFPRAVEVFTEEKEQKKNGKKTRKKKTNKEKSKTTTDDNLDDLINRIKQVEIEDKKSEKLKEKPISAVSPIVCIDLLNESIVNGNIKNSEKSVKTYEKSVKSHEKSVNSRKTCPVVSENVETPVGDKENSIFSPKQWNFVADLSCLNDSEEVENKSRVSNSGYFPDSKPEPKFDNSADLFVTPECRRPIESKEHNFSESPVLVSLADRLKNKKKLKFLE